MAMTKTIQATVKNRTDTAANWTQKNPVLAEGEIIVVQTSAGETRLKIGDGVKTFTQLPYIDEQIYNNVVTSVNGQTGDITIKSAYQYAQDGGYTGTETEFSEKLASGALIVHVTGVDDNLSADKTYVDIRDAILAGTTVLVDRGELYLPLVSINTEYPFLVFGTTICVNDDTGKMVYASLIEITQNDEVKDISALVDIPTTLPNPNAITFTGAVTGTYDGSEAVTINIPEGSAGNMKKLTFTGAVTGEYDGTTDVNIDIPTATTSTAGIIKIGNGLSVSADGTLSVTTATYYTGTVDPANTLGVDGDLYLKTEG